jgi:hypothetical protein
MINIIIIIIIVVVVMSCEVLGLVPVLHPLRGSWSFHLFLGRPMLLFPYGLYFSACLGNLMINNNNNNNNNNPCSVICLRRFSFAQNSPHVLMSGIFICHSMVGHIPLSIHPSVVGSSLPSFYHWFPFKDSRIFSPPY